MTHNKNDEMIDKAPATANELKFEWRTYEYFYVRW